ncbi:MAG TPA: hypothetical protein VK036_00600 [Wenzhouxiangella sp.]|nr:hypothetical protein [Wenzhouxiangella sp.]
MKIFGCGCSLVAGLMLVCTAAVADPEGHGPDAWQIVDVEEFDALPARMGPGEDYMVVADFMAGERGLKQVTCVPYVPTALYFEMSEDERDGLPERWCLMRSADFSAGGWIPARFAREDGGFSGGDDAEDALPMRSSENMIPYATRLVERLYGQHLSAARGKAPGPLHDAAARLQFFDTGVIKVLEEKPLQYDPLFGAQDFEGEVVKIEPDADQPMLRGTIFINVDFINFGRKQRATHALRVDTQRRGKPLRIINIQHEDDLFPEY